MTNQNDVQQQQHIAMTGEEVERNSGEKELVTNDNC